MRASRYQDFKWTADQIVEAVLTWHTWPGFSGEHCHHCKKAANVLAGGPGWICVCGAYNVQGWHGHRMPHIDPILGPIGRTLANAHEQLVYPPYVHRWVFVRRRQHGDQRWRIVLKAKDGEEHRPDGCFYTHEGSREETDLMLAKLKDWPQHRDYTLVAEAA